MKILHCADIHLDSKMENRLSPDQARERRNELLEGFHRMISYAGRNNIEAVLISGDLFDRRHIRKVVKEEVKQELTSHGDIDFYYLRGNHDITDFLDDLEEVPANLHLFSADRWTSYQCQDNIVITGREMDAKSQTDLISEMVLDPSKVNIVMLHGQDRQYQSHDNAYTIDIPKLRGRYIDYLALGHIHSYRWEELDDRGVLCYPGCPEGRGFDECGKKGFVVLDIDSTGVKSHEFVSLARRQCHQIKVEVEADDDLDRVVSKVRAVIEKASLNDLIRVDLTGRKNMDLEIDCDWIRMQTDRGFYVYDVKDDTSVRINYENFAHDWSLKGTFVRTVQGLDIDEERKAEIIELGIRAIMEGSLTE